MFKPSRIRWGTANARDDLSSNIATFARTVVDDWQVYWCAGVGVTGSSPEAFREEIAAFTSFLAALERALGSRKASRGALFLASSAGGIYGGSLAAPFDEQSSIAPVGAYGDAKLAMEGALKSFAAATGVLSVAGRISNLYGPGQNLDKAQGLISRLALSSITREPLSIFVSFDTIRDYIYVDDCADLAIASADRLHALPSSDFNVKIVASGRSVTVGELLNEFRHISGYRPLVVTGASALSSFQNHDLRLRSRHWVDLDQVPKINLSDGIARTLQDMRSKFMATP